MKKNTHTMVVFSLMDLPSDERLKLEDQIIVRAVAHWQWKQTLRRSANPKRTANRYSAKR